MKSGVCPKCESTEVYGDTNNPHGIIVDRTKIIPMNTIVLVCADCGYLELYVENEKDLERIKNKFGKVEN